MPEYDDLVPEAESLYEHLESTLEEVPNRISPLGKNLVTPQGQVMSKCRSFSGQDPENWDLKISPNWQFELEDSRDFDVIEGRAVIGGHLEVRNGEYNQCSFNLSILQKGDQSRPGIESGEVNGPLCCVEDRSGVWTMVRRFHFDMDLGQPGHEAKPVCHLQTGGIMGDRTGMPEFHYCRTGIRKPRIPHPPMDLVLVLDLLFSQYNNLTEYRDKDWISLVKKSEKKLWKPYFEGVGDRYRVGNISRVALDIITNQKL